MARGKHPNSKKNLKLWEKGQSANPAGRPPGIPNLRDRMAKYMEMEITGTAPDGSDQKMTVSESIVLALLTKAKSGDVPAVKEALDRYYGKETQPLEIMTKEKIETTISMEDRIKKYVK